MAPSCLKVWFHTSWILEKENSKHLAFVVGKRPITGEDSDAKVFCKHLLDLAAAVIDANLRHHVHIYFIGG